MDKKLETRISRLERMMNRKFEDTSSERFIEIWDLVAILMSLAGVSHANSILNNEKEILENILETHKDQDEISLDLPIKARGFIWGGTLSELLSSIFHLTEGVNKDSEKAVKTQSSIKRKYGL